MSVIVRTPDGRIVLYCKGADSVVYERLSASVDPALKDKTTKDIDMFANGGLRTLCIAYRVLTEDQFLMWVRTYDAATAATENREEEVEKAASNIEQELLLLGATALEDKLQVGVPEAIETLHRAGIKLWILTGEQDVACTGPCYLTYPCQATSCKRPSRSDSAVTCSSKTWRS